jgi:hypothetical protein
MDGWMPACAGMTAEESPLSQPFPVKREGFPFLRYSPTFGRDHLSIWHGFAGLAGE